jgi:hypothetical protein
MLYLISKKDSIVETFLLSLFCSLSTCTQVYHFKQYIFTVYLNVRHSAVTLRYTTRHVSTCIIRTNIQSCSLCLRERLYQISFRLLKSILFQIVIYQKTKAVDPYSDVSKYASASERGRTTAQQQTQSNWVCNTFNFVVFGVL